MADHASVAFFREGGGDVAGAESRFEVDDFNAAVEADDRAGHGGGGVTLDEHHVGLFFFKYLVEAGHHADNHVVEGLSGFHDS